MESIMPFAEKSSFKTSLQISLSLDIDHIYFDYVTLQIGYCNKT
jgi:hypothetical protein